VVALWRTLSFLLLAYRFEKQSLTKVVVSDIKNLL
jgi:hypothetical protein